MMLYQDIMNIVCLIDIQVGPKLIRLDNDSDDDDVVFDSYRLLNVNGFDRRIEGDIPLEKDINASSTCGQHREHHGP